MPTAESLALCRRSVDAESLLRSYSLYAGATNPAPSTALAPETGHGKEKRTTFCQVGMKSNRILNVFEEN